MTGRKTLEDLLGPISAQLGRDAVPENVELPVWEHVPVRATDGLDQDALVDMFAAEAEKIRVTVHRCTRETVAAEIAGIVAADPGSVVLAADAELQEMGVAEALADA